MDRGDLVPDEVICRVIMERVDSPEAEDGFLLDGFPRTPMQAETLEDALKRRGPRLTAAPWIGVPEGEAVRRPSGRRVRAKNERPSPPGFEPPHSARACDPSGSTLSQPR